VDTNPPKFGVGANTKAEPSTANGISSMKAAEKLMDKNSSAHVAEYFDPTPRSSYSLFAEILDWLLVPLLIVWPISFVIALVVAFTIANRPYDQALIDSTRALVDQVALINGKLIIALPNPETNILRADDTDIIAYRITSENGAPMIGDSRLTPITYNEEHYERGSIYVQDATIDGQDARVAFIFTSFRNQGEAIDTLVQVAETKKKRTRLATEITAFAMVLLFATMPTGVLLLWFGLSRGLQPVVSLRERINTRLPNDLSPIDPQEVPEELQPMIATINQQLSRVRVNLHAQQRFVADAAHQMRTPLAGLKTQAEVALTLDDPIQTRERLRQITLSADRAAHLINQLLLLAKADDRSGKENSIDIFSSDSESIDLAVIARDATISYVPRAMEKGIDLGFEEAPGRHRTKGDAALLSELVKNLVDNAIKYTPKGGVITVRINRDISSERSLVLEVEDSGIGIPEADREQVFERFYRALGTGESGSGLGLAIVRSIARYHNASVTVAANSNGQGSVFIVQFTLALG
jgi:two-component system, OmpR family, sensor histidine kinase TctE